VPEAPLFGGNGCSEADLRRMFGAETDKKTTRAIIVPHLHLQ